MQLKLELEAGTILDATLYPNERCLVVWVKMEPKDDGGARAWSFMKAHANIASQYSSGVWEVSGTITETPATKGFIGRFITDFDLEMLITKARPLYLKIIAEEEKKASKPGSPEADYPACMRKLKSEHRDYGLLASWLNGWIFKLGEVQTQAPKVKKEKVNAYMEICKKRALGRA